MAYKLIIDTIKIPVKHYDMYKACIKARADYMVKQPGVIDLKTFEREVDAKTKELLFIGTWDTTTDYYKAHDRLMKHQPFLALIQESFGWRTSMVLRLIASKKSHSKKYDLVAELDKDKIFQFL